MRGHVKVWAIGLAAMMSWVNSASAATVVVGSTQVAPGASGVFTVTLRSEGQSIKGAINEIEFSAATPITSCTPNPAYATASTINLLPEGCTAGSTCTRVRAVVALFTGAFPDVTDLYACTVAAGAATLPAQYELACQNPSASDPAAMPVALQCSSGFVEVLGGDMCLGDKSGDQSIDATEVVATINCFAQDDLSLNPQADGNSNGSCEANEVVQVIGNFAQDECNAFQP